MSVLRRFLAVAALTLAVGISFSGRAAAAEPAIGVVTTVFPPYTVEESAAGRRAAAGPATAIVRAVLAEAGVTAEIEVLPWARAYQTALHTPNTLIYLIARTPEREELFKWVGEVVDYDVHLYRSADRPDIAPADLAGAAKFIVGGLIKDVKTAFLERHGVPVQPYADETNGLMMLLRGRIDLMPSDAKAMAYRLEATGLPALAVVPVLRLDEVSRPLYLAFNRETDDGTVERFRTALAHVRHPDGRHLSD